MALSKQLFILISLLFLVVFAVNYMTSVNNIRAYLQTEAKIHADDTATALGISLQPHIGDKDDTIIPTIVNAMFDRGYFGAIILTDVEDKVLLERKNPTTFSEVPSWFSSILPLETATAVAEINDGWNIAAKVMIDVHPGYAYLKLWDQAKRALIYSVAAYALSMLVLWSVLRLVLKPLQKIEQQAQAIGDGEFIAIEPLPWTKEIKSVARAMNLMSGKIGKIISSLQSKLGDAERKLTTDAVTGLDTKQTFDAALKQLFISNAGGHVFLIRIEKLAELARSKSNTEVDKFLKEFASCIKDVSADKSNISIYRLRGGEFAIIAESIDRAQAEQLCKGLADGFNELGKKAGLEGIAHIGGIAFDPLGTTESIMSAALESYNKARLVGLNSFVIGEKAAGALSKDEWAALVRSIIDEGRAEISLSDRAEGLSGEAKGKTLLEEATAKIYGAEGQEISIGTFISVAEELGLVSRFDLMILNKVIDHIRSTGISHDVGVNLSFTSIADPDFRSQLYRLIEDNKDIAGHLVFCLTAYAAARDLKLLASFKDLVRRTGTKLMIKRYEPRFMDLDLLKKFNFDYIRLARIFTQDLAVDDEKKTLITTMVETGSILNTTILAESVSPENLQQVVDLGVDGASKSKE